MIRRALARFAAALSLSALLVGCASTTKTQPNAVPAAAPEAREPDAIADAVPIRITVRLREGRILNPRESATVTVQLYSGAQAGYAYTHTYGPDNIITSATPPEDHRKNVLSAAEAKSLGYTFDIHAGSFRTSGFLRLTVTGPTHGNGGQSLSVLIPISPDAGADRANAEGAPAVFEAVRKSNLGPKADAVPIRTTIYPDAMPDLNRTETATVKTRLNKDGKDTDKYFVYYRASRLDNDEPLALDHCLSDILTELEFSKYKADEDDPTLPQRLLLKFPLKTKDPGIPFRLMVMVWAFDDNNNFKVTGDADFADVK